MQVKNKETCIGRTFISEYVRPDKRKLVFYFHCNILTESIKVGHNYVLCSKVMTSLSNELVNNALSCLLCFS